MNDCTACQQLFSEYLDHQLDAIASAHLEHHLSACRECHAEWEYFTAAVSRLRQSGMIPPPSGILAGVHQKLAAQTSRQNVFTRMLHWLRHTDFSMSLPTAAGTVAIALVAMLIIRDFGGPTLSFRENTTPHPDYTIAKTAAPITSQPAATASSQRETTRSNLNDLAEAAPIQTLSLDQHLTELHWQFMANSFRYAPRGAAVINASTGRNASGPKGQSFEDALSTGNSFFHTFFQIAAQRPDVEVSIRNCPEEARLSLCRKLINSTDWLANVRDENTILLSVPPSKMASLNTLLHNHDAQFTPPSAREASFVSPRNSLLVTVRLQ